ncbi:hypothetical protein, partial [Streptomyces sp. TRM68416]|uniref:hypothetical protein n=1 Tax=Streptomyces sp. TRM68416 TaxID=2758412 RepID=UPI0019C905DB|nr:hypothetical protein [Streptomyces sp. TRM68416]
AGAGQPEQVQGPAGEADIRRALMGVPLSRLREAGLMKPLLVLLGLDDPDSADSADSAASAAGEDVIDEMAVEDLLQIALGTDS